MVFVALTYAISWAIWVSMVLASMSIGTAAGAVLNIVAIGGPTIAALIIAAAMGGGELRTLMSGLAISRAPIGWLLVALGLPLAMIGVAIGVSVSTIGGPAPVITAGVLATLVVEFVRILLVGGGQEEVGWRGFALPRLQLRWSAFDASVVLGMIWGLWHIPLYFVPGTGQFETLRGGTDAVFAMGAFVVWTVGLSVLFTWLFNQTRSLLIVIVFHASVNLASFVPAAVGSTGAASLLYALVTWVVALVVVARYGRATLGSAGPVHGQTA